MLRSTTCSDWLISLIACSSLKLKLVAILVLVLFNIVFFTWYGLTSYSLVLPVSIYAFVFWLWSICYRLLYTLGLRCISVSLQVKFFQLYFCYFTIVFLAWNDVTPYSIVLLVSISALVFRLWSICFRCNINKGYLVYSIGIKVYFVCTSFD